jgi:hypothetical protein|nr:MAG TPA: Pvc1, Pvc9, Pvc11, Pvc12, Pvc4, Photorhabdus asymbiotica, PVC, contractile.5A [Caudoviricetes sp.]
MSFIDNAKKMAKSRMLSKQADLQKTLVSRATREADKLTHGLVGKVLDYMERRPSTDIVFHSELTDEYVTLPVVPNPLPTISEPQANDTFNGLRGDIKLIGPLGLRTLSLDNILLPVGKDYSFIRGNGTDGAQVLSFFQAQRQMKAVMRICIIQTDGTEILNMPCVINDLSYSYDKVGDIKATVSIEEYVYTNVSTQTQSATGGENTEEGATK